MNWQILTIYGSRCELDKNGDRYLSFNFEVHGTRRVISQNLFMESRHASLRDRARKILADLCLCAGFNQIEDTNQLHGCLVMGSWLDADRYPSIHFRDLDGREPREIEQLMQAGEYQPKVVKLAPSPRDLSSYRHEPAQVLTHPAWRRQVEPERQQLCTRLMQRPTDPDLIAYPRTSQEMWWDGERWVTPSRAQLAAELDRQRWREKIQALWYDDPPWAQP